MTSTLDAAIRRVAEPEPGILADLHTHFEVQQLYYLEADPQDFTGPYVLPASREQSGPITGHAIQVDGGTGVRGFRSDAGGDHL